MLTDDYQVSKKVALQLVATVSEEKILRNIDYTNKEYKKGTVSNLIGYMVNAIKNDYANTVSLFEVTSKKKTDTARKTKELAEKRTELSSKFSLEFSRLAKEQFLNSLTDNEKAQLKTQILEQAELDSFSVELLKKTGLNSPIAGKWIIQKIPDFEKNRDQFVTDKLKKAGF